MNRAEVYEAVWAAPMAQAAATFGVGERALAKACRKAGIPTPPRGHWRKVAAGQAGERPPLGDAPAGKDAVTMPHEAPSQRNAATQPGKPWPTGLLQGDGPRGRPPSVSALPQPDFSPRMVDAVVDALAIEHQRAEAKRALLVQVISDLSACSGPDAPEVALALQLLHDAGSRETVGAVAAFITAATQSSRRRA